MQDQDLFKNYTMQRLLDEFDIIECFEQPDAQIRIGEVTKRQSTLRKDWHFTTNLVTVVSGMQVTSLKFI